MPPNNEQPNEPPKEYEAWILEEASHDLELAEWISQREAIYERPYEGVDEDESAKKQAELKELRDKIEARKAQHEQEKNNET